MTSEESRHDNRVKSIVTIAIVVFVVLHAFSVLLEMTGYVDVRQHEMKVRERQKGDRP